MRSFLSPAVLAVALALAASLAACDFTPALDIDTPEFAPALTINGVLAADSTVEVSITAAADPYGLTPVARDSSGGPFTVIRGSDESRFVVPNGLTAEIWRDGTRLGALRRISRPCSDDGRPDVPTCETMVSDVVTEAGGRYTVRTQAPGFPLAEATVTVPTRPVASVTGGASRTVGPRTDTDLTVTFQDPPGLGQRYALMVVTDSFTTRGRTYTGCDESGCVVVRDTTFKRFSNRSPVGYTTSNPILLAGARTIPSSGTDFITFTDESFDGQTRAFSVRAQQFDYAAAEDRQIAPLAGAWVVSIDAATFGAYQIAWFSLGEGNPFREPTRLPSNVIGGYGILGAVTITEARLPK